MPGDSRGARLEESLEIIKRLWAEDEVSFEGRFFRIPKVPGMQHWQVLRSIQLLGERVLPALR